MQEFIEWVQAYEYELPLELQIKAKEALEKEKEHIIEFGYKCKDSKNTLPQDIFNSIYNQNK